ncbi:hypothetical protein BBD42_14970 [Paenibacillus sp. BIHB 4019]|uniref:Uncharacterized protein n=1 Tax=Paenibacillus sp. BIHB 4019 TaxID=1870819 RepID=A0A1B2DIT3_9BACL|nr:hypothetical protein [Paenibacillus sp. BIHB 4019]ANY67634.1 hypothetical protein BBD42_14970 [Paenibacillus sp. BIHB 4019]
MGNAGLTYKLMTDHGEFKKEEINMSVITDIIYGFEPDYEDFIVLEPSLPLDNSIYLQAATEGKGMIGFVVEIRFVYADDSFKHYDYKTTDKGEIVRMFLEYWGAQKLPDHSQWNDITSTFT